MPQVTYPNQRIINIHRERASSDFLGIKNSNWMAASRVLGAHALRLYLYLAANRDGYILALSPAAIQEAIGMPASTYRDQFRKLQNFGYIENVCGNTYNFYEVPRAPLPSKEMGEQREPSTMDFEEEAAAVDKMELPADLLMSEGREINNNAIQQIEETINNRAAASSRVPSVRADEAWPDYWYEFAARPDQLFTEAEVEKIKEEEREAWNRPPTPIKHGTFVF